MVSLESLRKPLEGAKADPHANVELRGSVHAPDPRPFNNLIGDWSVGTTPCGLKYKHHDRERNRRTDKPLSCLLCLMEE